MDKVFIVTEAFPMQAEEYTKGRVYLSLKKVEKAVRTKYPQAKKEDSISEGTYKYLCKENQNTKLVFIHVENVD